MLLTALLRKTTASHSIKKCLGSPSQHQRKPGRTVVLTGMFLLLFIYQSSNSFNSKCDCDLALWRKSQDEEGHDTRVEERKRNRDERDERRRKRHEDDSDSDDVISDDTDEAKIYNYMDCINADDENEDNENDDEK